MHFWREQGFAEGQSARLAGRIEGSDRAGAGLVDVEPVAVGRFEKDLARGETIEYGGDVPAVYGCTCVQRGAVPFLAGWCGRELAESCAIRRGGETCNVLGDARRTQYCGYGRCGRERTGGGGCCEHCRELNEASCAGVVVLWTRHNRRYIRVRARARRR